MALSECIAVYPDFWSDHGAAVYRRGGASAHLCGGMSVHSCPGPSVYITAGAAEQFGSDCGNDNFQAALAVLPDHPYKDETGQLTSEFRVMLQRIDALIRDNYKKQLLLQETQYKMLQAQINPHFLNNTLNTVSWMIRAGRNDDATRVVIELGQLLRAALSKEEEMFVSQEVQLVKVILPSRNSVTRAGRFFV